MTDKLDIAPRYDADGVPRCSFDCPVAADVQLCGSICPTVYIGEVCPIAVKRMAEENEKLKQLEKDRWSEANRGFGFRTLREDT